MKYIQQGNRYNNTSVIINYIICVVIALFNYNYNKGIALLKWKRNSKHFLFVFEHFALIQFLLLIQYGIINKM